MLPEEPDRSGSRAGRFHSTCWDDVLAARDPAAPEAREALAGALPGLLVPALRLRPPQGAIPASGPRTSPRDSSPTAWHATSSGRVDPARGQVPVVPAGLVRELPEEPARAARSGSSGAGGSRPSRSTPGTPRPGTAASRPTSRPPSGLYDRRWALTLLDRALDRLERKMAGQGKGPLFDRLKPALLGRQRRRGLRPGGRRAGHDRGGRQGGRPPAAGAARRPDPRGDRRDGRRPVAGRRRDPRPVLRPGLLTPRPACPARSDVADRTEPRCPRHDRDPHLPALRSRAARRRPPRPLPGLPARRRHRTGRTRRYRRSDHWPGR